MDKCFIYIRVSTEEQVLGYSPEAQERAARSLASAEDLQVAGFYQDLGESARTDRRPDFQRMMTDLRDRHKRERITALIIDNLDRFMRNLRLLLNFQHELSKLGIRLLSATEEIDTESDNGIIMFQLKGMLAEQFLRNLSREVKKGLREKAQQGDWVGGICPYGYTRVDKNTIAPTNDASTEAVKRLFDLYETHHYSYAQLADSMNAESECWGRRFGVEAVRDIIRNKAYCGYVSCGGVEYPGKHTAIITELQWQACAVIRETRATNKWSIDNPKPPSNPQSLLVGYGYCGACDQQLWTSTSGNERSRNTYYRCAGSSRRNCAAKLQPTRIIDDQLIGLVSLFSLNAQWQESTLQGLLTQTAPPPPVIDRAAIQSKIDRLSMAWVAGNLSDGAYEKQLTTLKQQLTIPELVVAPTVDIEQVIAMVQNLNLVIDYATVEERRALLRLLFDRVWIQERNIKAVQPKPLYATLLDCVRRPGAGGGVKRAGNGALPLSSHLAVYLPLWQSIPIWSSYQVVFSSVYH